MTQVLSDSTSSVSAQGIGFQPPLNGEDWELRLNGTEFQVGTQGQDSAQLDSMQEALKPWI